MKLTPGIGNEIVQRAQLVLGRKILVTNEVGQVMAGDAEGMRKGTILDALRACQEGKVIRSSIGDTSVSWCPFVYEQQTIGAFGVTEEDVQVTPEALSLLQGLAEVITHQHFLLERVQPSGGVQAKFLRELLTAPSVDPTESFRQADILQLNLRPPQAIILIKVSGLEPSTDKEPSNNHSNGLAVNGQIEELTTTIHRLFEEQPDNVVAYLGDEVFVVLKGIGGSGLNTRNTTRFLRDKGSYLHRSLVQKLPQQTVTIGVGQYYPDLGGLRKSYQEAKLALTVGSRVWDEGEVYHIRRVGMFVTLANTAYEHKAELAHQILHPLLRDEQLYKTVRLFLEEGLNLTRAAEKLHVHRNTLIYRLDKVSRLINLDPRVFEDALQIKLGLMFYQDAELPATSGPSS